MSAPDSPPPIPLADPLIGSRLGEYEVLAAVGEGGMGVVYRGIQPIIGKQVAIKVLRPAFGDDSHSRRLADEAVAVNSIRHRNIVDIFSFGQLPDGRPYIVMEFLEGTPLDVVLRRQGRLALPDALELLQAVCIPLFAAHRAGVIHRDLKPSNVFLCHGADGERYVKLLDFGLAKKTLSEDGTTAQTHRAWIIGTPDYMAPEQARGEKVSARTDLYALGVMAYELITGQIPFPGSSPMDVLLRHASAPIPSARALLPDCPEALDGLIAQLLAKEPPQRPASAEEVRHALREVARSLTSIGAPLSPPTLHSESAHLENRTAVEGQSQARASLSPSTVRKRRWSRLAGVLAVTTLLAVAATAAWRLVTGPSTGGEQPAASTSAANTLTAQAEDHAPSQASSAHPPESLAAPSPLQVPAEPEKPSSPEATAPSSLLAPPKVAATARVDRAPTAEQLRRRVARLEAALAQTAPAGEDPDPSAVTLLRKYRLEALMENPSDARWRLSKSLDAFERTFLGRSGVAK